jgi:hypothetical protein
MQLIPGSPRTQPFIRPALLVRQLKRLTLLIIKRRINARHRLSINRNRSGEENDGEREQFHKRIIAQARAPFFVHSVYPMAITQMYNRREPRMSAVRKVSRLLISVPERCAEETNMTPTERAKMYLNGSVENFRNAKMNKSIYLIALGLEQQAQGLQEMATGLRAVYLKLEALEKSIDRPAGLSLSR